MSLFALLLVLFYALQVPLCLYVRADTETEGYYGWGVGIIGMKGAKKRAMQPQKKRRRREPKALQLEKNVWMKAAFRGADYLYAHRMLLRVRVDAVLGGMDADVLALWWGAGSGLLEALSACTDGRVSGQLYADFSASATLAHVRLSYAARSGVVLRAAFHTVREAVEESVRKWISIPSKAS